MVNHIMPPCKHIVIPSGVMYGFAYYGALREAHRRGLWTLDSLTSIYATSAGALVAVLIALGYDWTTSDKYVIDRPWHHIFKFTVDIVMRSFSQLGLFGKEAIADILIPLLEGKDLSRHVTLREFYEATHIELHLFVTELTTFRMVDVSHTTHPDWLLVDAVAASAAAPIVLRPVVIAGATYVDGAVFANTPLQPLLDARPDIDPDEILVLNPTRPIDTKKTSYDGLLDYLTDFLFKCMSLLMNSQLRHDAPVIRHNVAIDTTLINQFDMHPVVTSTEKRRMLIAHGVASVDALMSTLEPME